MYQPTQLGARIRHFRKAKGLTQSELAQSLFVTPQNVSKWENGQSAPDVEKLCALCEALGVSADRLLGGEPSAHGRVMIGIDGGGTKTEFCLFDENGCVLAREKLGGTNPNTLALIYCGYIVYELGLKNLRFEKGLGVMVIFRLMISPIICATLCSVFGITGLPHDVFVVGSGLPVVSQITVMAGNYGADDKYAATGATLSTFGSFLSIPILMVLLG